MYEPPPRIASLSNHPLERPPESSLSRERASRFAQRALLPGLGEDVSALTDVRDGAGESDTHPRSGGLSNARARVGISGRALVGLAVFVALCLAVLAAVLFLRPDPVVYAIPDQNETGSATLATEVPSETKASEIYVYVSGAVSEPSVVTLKPDARVTDAVQEAGGLLEEADTSRINLAAPLTDGQHIHVPRVDEEIPAELAAPATGSGGKSAAGQESAAGAVHLNSATTEQLEQVPGIGPVMAERIVKWRDEHGGFAAIEDLLEVEGIGEKTLEELKPYVDAS